MIVLGSTGSIGCAALDVAARFNLPIETLVAGFNVDRLNEQIRRFKPRQVVLADRAVAQKVDFPNAQYGKAAILDAIASSQSDLVVNALSGFAGLRPTLKALQCGKRLALANKESLACVGAFLDTTRISPIDSEHFGVWYLNAAGDSRRLVKRIVLTASGGALRDCPIEEIERAPIERVLRHPNWSMGAKITIDSATMVNKLFELLEARWLFGANAIDAVIERSSIFHALIEFADGCVTAQAAPTDMRLAITYAILGELREPIAGEIDLISLPPIRFEPIDLKRYPAWAIKETLLNEPRLGAVLNAANEAAIARYRSGEISFGRISRMILEAFERFSSPPKTIDEAIALHEEVYARFFASRSR
ncbi:MAG: 1-deoxy-D-xylulose-5-phosphate reductoisomerase [Helicobacteraceae bacterium]|jgi:1-deoxy-D-xylulose-5-phosphate reductoisomerase|nr:1-deoxy-D-xylulose-5-phosphate reductoisomerase [Helicobacteraceae bacterium]